MRIFDNNLLKQYLDVGAEVKVYANHEWYDIVDKSDLADSIDACGQDEYGGTHRFSYQTIEQIQINGQIITLDMLSKKMGDKVEDDGKSENKPEKKDDLDVPEEDDSEDKPEKGPDLSWFSPAYDIGRMIIKEKEERMKSGNKI